MPSRRRFLRPLASCLLFLPALLWSPTARAFCPTNGLRCGLSGVGVTHEDLTQRAMEELGAEFFGTEHSTRGMRSATEEVWKANAEVDDDQANGFKHFDGESFVAGKQRLVSLFDGTLRSLRAEDAQGGRRQLGQALHTLQDFYAHSNWMESGHTGALTSLWRPEQPLPTFAGEDVPTCEACEFVIISDGSLLVDCGHNLSTVALTSGFYGGENEVPRHASKCRHGGPTDTGPGPFGGINKDTRLQTLSPHHPLHDAAADSALEASKQFIRDLQGQLTERQLKLLFGVGPTLTVAVDTSAGMGSLLLQATRQLGQLIESRLGTGQEPLRYVLVPFQGASTSSVQVTSDPREFRSALSALGPSARGTCSAPSMTAVLQALEASEDEGDLFLLTQSRASDDSLASTVSGLARSKHTRIHSLLAGSCGGAASTETVYSRLAEETGGQVFSLRATDAGVLAQLVDATVRANAVTLLSLSDARGGGRSLRIPVDASLSQVTFSLSGSPSLRLIRPDGSLVSARDAGVRIAQGATGILVTVLAPAPGPWSATLSPAGAFSFQVLGESPVDVDRFEFVEAMGRLGHQGYLAPPGLPVLSTLLATARLSGDISSARFELRSPEGALLQTLALTPEPGGSPLEFFGPAGLSSQPFVVYGVGRTSGGDTWQRVLPGVVRPRTVRLLAPATQGLIPGSRSVVSFQVHNTGASNIFRPSVLTDRRFGARVTPELLVLGQGQVGVFTVQWEAPRDAAPGTTATLATTVESLAPQGMENFADVVGVVAGAPR